MLRCALVGPISGPHWVPACQPFSPTVRCIRHTITPFIGPFGNGNTEEDHCHRHNSMYPWFHLQSGSSGIKTTKNRDTNSDGRVGLADPYCQCIITIFSLTAKCWGQIGKHDMAKSGLTTWLCTESAYQRPSGG